MAASSTDQTGGFKRFSGAGANGRDLKRWKTWCLSKMITMSTLTKDARGTFVYSMLDGDEGTRLSEWCQQGLIRCSMHVKETQEWLFLKW